MRIRFRDTCPSTNRDFPFVAGQIIAVEELTPELRAALDAKHAEILPEPPPELAMQGPPPETTARAKGGPRGSR